MTEVVQEAVAKAVGERGTVAEVAVPPSDGINTRAEHLRSYFACVQKVAAAMVQVMVSHGETKIVSRFTQPPNFTHFPVEANGGIALQMDGGPTVTSNGAPVGTPYRLLTALGAIPLVRGEISKETMDALTERFGLKEIVPRVPTTNGYFGPVYSISVDAEGKALPDAVPCRATPTPEAVRESSELWKLISAAN